MGGPGQRFVLPERREGSELARLRIVLLGSVAAGALLIATPGPARAQVTPADQPACSISGAVVTCSGDLATGVLVDNVSAVTVYTTLNVNSLTTSISPQSGTAGLDFVSNGGVTITSNTGTHGVTSSNDSGRAYGIRAVAGEAVTITSTGDIATTATDRAAAIYAYSAGGGITVTSSGTLTANGSQAYGIGSPLFQVGSLMSSFPATR